MANGAKFIEDLVGGVKSAGSILKSNKAINEIGSNMGGVFEAGGKMFGKEKMGFQEAVLKTFATNGDKLFDEAGKRIKDVPVNLNYGKIAGSYIGAAAVGRVVTGGGIYKDKNGNSNLIGVPFI